MRSGRYHDRTPTGNRTLKGIPDMTKVTDKPEVRPTPEDAWTWLIVEMRRNNLPAPASVYDYTDELSVQLKNSADLRAWARHFGVDVTAGECKPADRAQYFNAADITLRGRRLDLYCYEKPVLAAPMSDDVAAVVDELAASVKS